MITNLGLTIINTSLLACCVKYFWTLHEDYGQPLIEKNDWESSFQRDVGLNYTQNPLLIVIFTGYRGITIAKCCVVIRSIWQTLVLITSFSFGSCRSAMVLVHLCIASPLQRHPLACPFVVARSLLLSSVIPYVVVVVQLVILPSCFPMPY